MATPEQKLKIKQMLVDGLQMRMAPEEIEDTISLFGEEGLGFDSVDAIEIVAGIEQEFGYAFENEEEAREVLVNVETLANFLESKGSFA
ncbi:MAG: acyl carrier protein [Planctomycetes bacterium]|nr:acyl carrier protein [Planctomycetota bacterium]